jgi:hypothetical protein
MYIDQVVSSPEQCKVLRMGVYIRAGIEFRAADSTILIIFSGTAKNSHPIGGLFFLAHRQSSIAPSSVKQPYGDCRRLYPKDEEIR